MAVSVIQRFEFGKGVCSAPLPVYNLFEPVPHFIIDFNPRSVPEQCLLCKAEDISGTVCVPCRRMIGTKYKNATDTAMKQLSLMPLTGRCAVCRQYWFLTDMRHEDEDDTLDVTLLCARCYLQRKHGTQTQDKLTCWSVTYPPKGSEWHDVQDKMACCFGSKGHDSLSCIGPTYLHGKSQPVNGPEEAAPNVAEAYLTGMNGLPAAISQCSKCKAKRPHPLLVYAENKSVLCGFCALEEDVYDPDSIAIM
jgi:hypothetical protein